jgi:hypothetical protein
MPGRGLRRRHRPWPRVKKFFLLRSRDNPKICWVDDSEVIGYPVSEFMPFFGYIAAKEGHDGVGEVVKSFVAFIVRGVLVHQAP